MRLFLQGRTGVMVSAYCLHDKIFDTAADALQFYSEARTENAKVSNKSCRGGQLFGRGRTKYETWVCG